MCSFTKTYSRIFIEQRLGKNRASCASHRNESLILPCFFPRCVCCCKTNWGSEAFIDRASASSKRRSHKSSDLMDFRNPCRLLSSVESSMVILKSSHEYNIHSANSMLLLRIIAGGRPHQSFESVTKVSRNVIMRTKSQDTNVQLLDLHR